jgi:oxaloacetate decarboxylase gamma subunit
VITSLLMEGVNLMLIGMGSVFSFLALLVVAMYGMSRLAAMIGPEEVETQSRSFPLQQGGTDDGEIIAVISAAINRYRTSRR